MRSTPVLIALLLAGYAPWVQADDCQSLSDRYAQNPRDMKIGELDELKTCINGVQRELISALGDASTAPGQVTIARPRAVPVLRDAE